jgi:uncharacterized protein (TIGR02266 family)
MTEAKGSKDLGSIPGALAGGRPSRPYSISDSSPLSTGEIPRDLRVPVVAQVRVRYGSILDFHESQSLNISRTGMFLACDNPGSVGSTVDFELALEDGLLLLKGKGEVVRVTRTPVLGMGVRFRELDEDSRKCLEGIVATNEKEGRTPWVPLDFASDSGVTEGKPVASSPARASHPLRGATRVQPGLSVAGHDLHVRLTPLTVGYFTNNPLINIRLGGFVIPIEEEASLGAAFDVAILDNDGISLFHGKGKVVAKDGHRIGVRLSDIDKSVLARLQAEVAKLSPGGR